MPVFAVLYDYAENSVDLRDEHRAAHRQFLDDLSGQVLLLASGPWADGLAGALLVFSGPDQQTVERALDEDPFAKVGAVGGREVRAWTQARGPWVGTAALPGGN